MKEHNSKTKTVIDPDRVKVKYAGGEEVCEFDNEVTEVVMVEYCN